MNVQELENAVTQLHPDEFAQFMAWVNRYQPNDSNQQPGPNAHVVTPENDPILARIRERLKHVLTDPDEIREAEEEFAEFKRNMNAPRKASGARLLYPEVEEA